MNQSAQVGHWTVGAALAYTKARPGDATADEIIRDLCAQLEHNQHATKRMLQALDGYWANCEGGNARYRHDHQTEDWWTRFERYRKRVEVAS